jgi:alanine racemase
MNIKNKLSRPILATIFSQHLQHNLQMARQAAPQAGVMAVIKANAYGHGLLAAAHALRDADAYALLNIEDALQLRAAGFSQAIILLEGVFSLAELQQCQAAKLSPVFHQPQQLDWLNALTDPTPLSVLLKLNSGMNRLGFSAEGFKSALHILEQSPHVSSITLMTHFACADEKNNGISQALAYFTQHTTDLPYKKSLANSAALLRYPESHADWVRAGIMLYGSSPFAEISAAELALLPSMQLNSAIISIQNLQAGDCVGYAASFCASQAMRVGIVACGYADGYPRHAPTGTPVFVEGIETRLLGRVSMDMLCVDLSHLPQAQLGSTVELWGQLLPIDRVAKAAGTISYELMCAIAPRVPMQVV